MSRIPRALRPRRECACCGETGVHEAHGWCARCYGRWRYAGKPAAGPPPLRRSTGRKPGPVADRVDEWRFFRGLGYSQEEIAARLGLSVRTVQRYASRDDIAVAV